MQGELLLCGVCAQSLRVDAKFCTRCGVEQGTMVAREAGAGRELHEPTPIERLHVGGRGLTIALAAYFAMLVPAVIMIRGSFASLSDMMWAELWIGAVGVVGMVAMWRDTPPLFRWPRVIVSPEKPARVTGAQVLIAIAAIAGILAIAHLMMAIVSDFALDEVLPYRLEGKGLAFALLHGAVLPAVVEELAFRGVVLTALLGIFRDRTALLMSSMMFAILHLSPLVFLHLTILGLLCGAARLKTRSLWPCIAIHMAYNAAVLLIAWT